MPEDGNEKQDKPVEKKPAYELSCTDEYAKEKGKRLPEPKTAREVVIVDAYNDASSDHLYDAGKEMSGAIRDGKEPFVSVVDDALKNPKVRGTVSDGNVQALAEDRGYVPRDKNEEREQWLGDREIMVAHEERKLAEERKDIHERKDVLRRGLLRVAERERAVAERADPTKPNATAKCEACGEDVPVGKEYQDRMTELDERERIVDMGRKETEALRKEIEAREKAAEGNEYFVGREKLNEAGWKDEAELGAYLGIMKPDVEPVTTESYTLNDGSLFKKAELATDSKIIGVKSANPIKIEKREKFFADRQQEIGHHAVHIEIWADEIANNADEKYAESYLKQVLEDVDAAADCAKRNDFVKAYEHLEKARKVPPPPGRRRLPMPEVDGADEEPVPPPAPSEDAAEEPGQSETQFEEVKDEQAAELKVGTRVVYDGPDANLKGKKGKIFHVGRAATEGFYAIQFDDVALSSKYAQKDDLQVDKAEPAEPVAAAEKPKQDYVEAFDQLADTLEEAEENWLEQKIVKVQFLDGTKTNRFVAEGDYAKGAEKKHELWMVYNDAQSMADVKLKQAEEKGIDTNFETAVLRRADMETTSDSGSIWQNDKWPIGAAHKANTELSAKLKKAEEPEPNEAPAAAKAEVTTRTYQGHALDLLFGGPKLTAEQAAKGMQNVLGDNYDSRIKITEDTDKTTLCRVITKVEVPAGSVAEAEINKFLAEKEAAKVIDKATADGIAFVDGGGPAGLTDQATTPAKSQSVAKRFFDYIRPELKPGETRGQYLKRKLGRKKTPDMPQLDEEEHEYERREPVDNHTDIDDDTPVEKEEEDGSLPAPYAKPDSMIPVIVKEKHECDKCGENIPIYTDKRPVRITCPNCGDSATLKAKEHEEEDACEEE